MSGNRLRWGACAWLATLQFFVVETVAQLRAEESYSRADDVISNLGAATSPASVLMNASFVVQGGLILAGVLLLAPVLASGAGRAAQLLLGATALGVLLVGVFPVDGDATLHAVGAVLYLLGGGLGLIALAYALRLRSEALGTTLAVLGLVGTAMTVFFLAEVTEFLGRGGTERAAAYVVPIGLAIAGAALWRMGPTPSRPGEVARPTGRELREQARAERARRERERDEALQATGGPATGNPSAGSSTALDHDPDDDPDGDPWAAPVRGRED